MIDIIFLLVVCFTLKSDELIRKQQSLISKLTKGSTFLHCLKLWKIFIKMTEISNQQMKLNVLTKENTKFKYMIFVKLLRNIRYQNKPCKNAPRNYSRATTGRVSANVLGSLSVPSSCNSRIWVTTSSKPRKMNVFARPLLEEELGHLLSSELSLSVPLIRARFKSNKSWTDATSN